MSSFFTQWRKKSKTSSKTDVPMYYKRLRQSLSRIEEFFIPHVWHVFRPIFFLRRWLCTWIVTVISFYTVIASFLYWERCLESNDTVMTVEDRWTLSSNVSVSRTIKGPVPEISLNDIWFLTRIVFVDDEVEMGWF